MSTFTTLDFVYNKKTKTMSREMPALGLDEFPRNITIKSVYTGRMVVFIYDEVSAEKNEFWDGELAEYIPVGDTNVQRLILFND